MPTTRAIEPIAAILALGIGKPLFLFALGALAIHLAVGDIIFKNQAALGANLGIATMVGSLTTRRRADKNRVTGVTPVLAASHLFTNRTLFHHNSSINSMITSQEEISLVRIIVFRHKFQTVVQQPCS